MVTLLTVLFLLVCFAMIVVILLQSSKGGGLAGAFGGSNMGAVFGGRGAGDFLSKTTTWLAVAFLAIALVLSLLNRGSTVSQGLVEREQQQRTSVPAAGLPVVPTPGNSGQVIPGATQPTPSDTAR